MAGSKRHRDGNNFPEDMRLVFGSEEKMKSEENDLLACTSKLTRSSQEKPFFYQWCGTEDFLYADNIAFRDHARKEGLDLLYEEGPGDHQWSHWDEKINRFLTLLPLQGDPMP